MSLLTLETVVPKRSWAARCWSRRRESPRKLLRVSLITNNETLLMGWTKCAIPSALVAILLPVAAGETATTWHRGNHSDDVKVV